MLLLVVAIAVDAAPDLNGGVWLITKPVSALRTVGGALPPMRAAARHTYEQHVADRKAGKLDFDSTERCLPPGLPRLLLMPQPFEFLQRPEQIIIMYQWNRLVRIIDMKPANPESLGPSHLGTSVGEWRGNTLEINTIDIHAASLLDEAGLPHGEQVKITERYAVSTDAQRLLLRLRIEDAEFYSAPWEATLQYRRDLNGEIAEDVCVERKNILLWKPKS
jgi:hypothetical protein